MRGTEAIRRLAQQAIANVNLPRNAAKGCWRGMSRGRLFWLLLVEVWELAGALLKLYYLRCDYERIPQWEYVAREHHAGRIQEARLHVKGEAGDCAAFLAFLMDRV